MAEVLNVGNRPYKVVEGIYEAVSGVSKKSDDIKTIVYTGKLNSAFGIVNLVKAFHRINNPNLRLVICGNGECRDEILHMADDDTRIIFKGQVSSDVARQCILDGDILVNPRPNNSVYTRYSFPSKILDYLASGNPTVAFKLDGMPEVYKNFIYYIPENTVESIANTILCVIDANPEDIRKRSNNALQYIKTHLSMQKIAQDILELNF